MTPHGVGWRRNALHKRSDDTMAQIHIKFREREYLRQAAFRATSATISSSGRTPVDKMGREYPYMLALGYEDENFYPTLRGSDGVRRFFDERSIEWWRHRNFDKGNENGPTRNMASSQIACVNFILPLASIENGLIALLAAVDDDVTAILQIVDPRADTASPVEFEWIGLGHALEGESETKRGKYSTSVDAFLIAETRSGRRGYLVEWKYTEAYGENDKGRGRKGRTRRGRYEKPYKDSAAFRDGVPLGAWLHDPFYQIMRQRLLADRMVTRKELGVSEAKVVLVCPDGNLDYRQSLTSPLLAAMFPEATSVEEVIRAATSDPDLNFGFVSQSEIGTAVRAKCGACAHGWSEYHAARYGW